MPVTFGKTPTIIRNYGTSAGVNTFSFTSGELAAGDLMVAHVSNGNNPAGQGETITNSSGGQWTKNYGFTNGRAVFTKTAVAADISTTHTLNNYSSSYGLAVWVIKGGAINTSRSGMLAGNTTSQASIAKASVSVKVFYNASMTSGNFPNLNNADSSNHIEWKSFASNTTLSTYTNAPSNWHSGAYEYAILTFEETNNPPVATITAPAASATLDPRLAIQVSWTYSDPEGSPQTKYELTYAPTGSSTSYVNSSTGRGGTIQSWTVPATGSYKIECWGAQGGNTGSGSYTGGKGAYRYGTISLTAGEVLKIIVGQRGGSTTSYYDGGGGGGSFVYKETGSDLLCAAGGGGGASINGSGRGGVTATAGTPGLNGASDYGTGGTNGSGGSGGYSASGAGWLANGGDNSWSPGSAAARPGSACKPGLTYISQTSPTGQACGGEANSYSPPSEGGFGGGGGAHGNYIGGAGGGGYSGGAGGYSGWGGGGGGSFVHASMTSNGGTSDTRTGHGAVTISSGTTTEYTSAAASHTIPANTLTDETPYTISIRVNDGTVWSALASVAITTDSWTYGTETTSGTASATVPVSSVIGDYQVQVRTSDAYGAGPWSSSATFKVLPTSNVKIYQGGGWRTVPKRLRHSGAWKVPPNPRRQ